MKKLLRRPLLIIALFLSIIAFSISEIDKNFSVDKKIFINGRINEVVEFENFVIYKVNKFECVASLDFSGCIVGQKIEIEGFKKNIDEEWKQKKQNNGILATIQVTNLKEKPASLFLKKFDRLKFKLSFTLENQYKENSFLSKNVVLGIKKDFPKILKEKFQNLGISHLLSISGLHLGIFFIMMKFFIGEINNLKRFFFILFCIIMYNLIVGFKISLIRATFFVIIYMLSFFLETRYDIISCASFCIIITLLLNFSYINNLGFKLSYLAVFSIGIYDPILKKYIKIKSLRLSLCSIILTLPLILKYFETYSSISLLSNMILVPIFSIYFNTTIITLIIGFINIEASKVFVIINSTLEKFFLYIVDILYKFYPYFYEIKQISKCQRLIYYIIVISIAIIWEIKCIKEQKNEVSGFY